MKTSIAKLALGLTLVSMSSMAMASLTNPGIADTKHNLGGSPNAGRVLAGGTAPWGYNYTNATTEICVFCHTPHGADSSATVPLWNRTLGTPADYQTYASLGTATLDGTDRPVGGVSLACLSCHDGTQAMNTVINSPGSSTTGDVNLDGDGNFIIPIGALTDDGDVTCREAGTTNCGGFREFNMMSQVSVEMIYLSTDLRNDHPISIEYAGAGPVGAVVDGNDGFHDAYSTTSGGGSTTVWYIDSSSPGSQSGPKTKSDFPLYNDGVGGDSLVECATCHDPHSTNKTFLRLPNNNGSAVCLSCHNK
jgi:predicted CXXCH cytochrome family protein